MKLTERDQEIIEVCHTGATLEQIAMMFFLSDVSDFKNAYKNASRRLNKLVKGKLLKQGINPTLGKKVFFTKSLPSVHSLVIADIKLALKDKYSFSSPKYWIGNTEVDFVMLLKSKKLLIFEIDIFNKTTQKKIDYINKTLAAEGKQGDIWILRVGRARRAYKGARTMQIGNLCRSNTLKEY